MYFRSLFDRLLSHIEVSTTSDRWLLRVMFFLVVFLGILFLLEINQRFLTTVPASGGTLTEGIIGIPRFVNPALAITRTDQDIIALLYSGLLRIDETGELVPDLAESVTLAPDGTMYTISLRKDRSFHDGTPITTRDVAFTIELIQNPELKSPLRGNWSDAVVNVIDEYTLTITLREAYTPFIENLTLGIMPHHIWHNLPIEQLPFSQSNTEPIGSGNYALAEVKRDTSGLISSYRMVPHPFDNRDSTLDTISLRFFQTEQPLLTALLDHEVDSTASLGAEYIATLMATEDFNLISSPLPRAFGIFFNQNKSPALRDAAAREALSAAVDRNALVATTLSGFGIPIDDTIIFKEDAVPSDNTATDTEQNLLPQEKAQLILETGGWKKGSTGKWEKRIDATPETLSVVIKTANTDLFTSSVNFVADAWRAIGVDVSVEQYEQTGLVQSVVRGRDFEALLFGIDMSRQQDLYPFWHSSQKDDPGLNVAQYTNINVDRLLEEARIATSSSERARLLDETVQIITKEYPAVFLYAPTINYVVAKDIVTAPFAKLGKPADRFANINTWYARTDSVWPLFTD